MSNLYEDLCNFMTALRSMFSRMTDFSDEFVEKIRKSFIYI